MARVGSLGASLGTLLMVFVAAACGDDDDVPDGELVAGAGQGGAPGSAGNDSAGDAGTSSSQSGLGGIEPGGESGAAGHAGASGGEPSAGQGGASGAGGESGGSAVTWLEDCDGIDLSADGTTVLATRGIWRSDEGWSSLPDLAGGSAQVAPRTLSRDGKVVFGNSGSSLGLELTRWENGVATGLGTLNTPYATNADGSLAIGLTPIEPAMSEGTNDDFDVFVWSQADGLDALEQFWDAVGNGVVVDPATMSFFMQQDAASGAIGLNLSKGSNTATSFTWTAAAVTSLSAELRIDALSPDGGVGAFRDAYKLTAPTSIHQLPSFALLDTPECVIEPDPEDGLAKCQHVHQVLTGFDQAGQLGVGFEEGQGVPPVAFFHWQQGQDAENLVSFLESQGITLTLPNAFTAKLARMSADGHTILGALTTSSAPTNRCFVVRY